MYSVSQSTFRDLDRLVGAIQLAQDKFPQLWTKALNDAADIAQKFMMRQFASQGGEFGTPWASLKPATMKDRERKGYKPARPILVRRGWLRASIVEKRSANHRRVITRGGIVMYSQLKTKSGLNLFTLHQQGTPKMPARKMVREGDPPWISAQGWNEIRIRFLGMFVELRRAMEDY